MGKLYDELQVRVLQRRRYVQRPSERGQHKQDARLTMRCELDSCAFWLYFFLRMTRIERSSSWYVWSGLLSAERPGRTAAISKRQRICDSWTYAARS